MPFSTPAANATVERSARSCNGSVMPENPTDSTRPRWPRSPLVWRCGLLAAWFGCVLFLALHHVMWRDEVRALMLARRGATLLEMLVQIRGYGHPALWHILLRAALTVYPHPIVLPLTAFLIGAAAATLFALKAPFRPLIVALALFSNFFAYEYVVVARNYGISALLLLVIAWAYPRMRDRPGMIGALLFLLCNTNIHSVVLALAFLLFWAADLHLAVPRVARGAWLSFLVAVAMVVAGAAVCVWQIYPPRDDAAMVPAMTAADALLALPLQLGPAFGQVMPSMIVAMGLSFTLPLLLVGSLLMLRRSPAAVGGAAAALIGLEGVFLFIYPGGYRHGALFIVFLLAMAWIAQEKSDATMPAPPSGRVDQFPLVALLALQVFGTAMILARVGFGIPESRSRDLAVLLARPALHGAIVVGDPDTTTEALSYYADNAIYLSRERRYGPTPIFSKAAAKRTMTIASVLATARALHAATRRPVVIVLATQLRHGMAPALVSRGYDYGNLALWPRDVEDFLASTDRIARFPFATSDEWYDVYVLKDARGQSAR